MKLYPRAPRPIEKRGMGLPIVKWTLPGRWCRGCCSSCSFEVAPEQCDPTILSLWQRAASLATSV
jgi:hypothetical protein